MELTKEFRNSVYHIMNNLLSAHMKDTTRKTNDRCEGLCYYMAHALNILGHGNINDDNYDSTLYVIDRYPELVTHRPKMVYAYWFPCNLEGAIKRASIIKEAIELTNP